MRGITLSIALLTLTVITVVAGNSALAQDSAAGGECWADPAPYDAPNYVVPCDSPECDIGPCHSATIETGVEATTSIPAHTPEWTNLNDSDPGATEAEPEPTKESGEKSGTADINIGVGELDEGAAEPTVTQRNESDLEFQRTRAEESSPNIFTRIWHFLTGWLW